MREPPERGSIEKIHLAGQLEIRPMARAIRMHEKDNVATVLEDVAPGDAISIEGGAGPLGIEAAEAVPFGHKIALSAIGKNKKIRKYGETIGIATRAIQAGTHVHVHNLKSARG